VLGFRQNCPNEINPVAGINGVTYLNPCYAEAAGISDYTFGVSYGECIDVEKMDPQANCLDVSYEPVCGCNNITYVNACSADAAGVQSYTEGVCPDTNRPNQGWNSSCYNPIQVVKSGGVEVARTSGIITLICTAAYDPVCGCDGMTYSNACVAEASGVTSYTHGACGDGCVDPSKIDQETFCPTAYEPVCGCNDVTYPSACDAEAAGVLSWTEGACSSSSWCEKAKAIQCGDFLPNESTLQSSDPEVTNTNFSNLITSYPGCSNKSFEAPENVYVINKNTAGDLQIGLEITTPGVDLDLFLLQGTCDGVVCLKSSTTSNTSTNNEGIILANAPIGTYYIVVDGQYAESRGDYRLEVSCGILDCSYAEALECGKPYQGTNEYGQDNVSLYKCGNTLNVENNGPEVVHQFSIPKAGAVDIYLTGLSANLELFLLGDCDRGECAKYSQNSGKKDEHISTYLEAGSYYVVVDGYNGAVSDYTLRVDCPSVCDLEMWVNTEPATCGKNDGKLIVESTGGTPGYIVSWEGPVDGQFYTAANTCTISNLPPGTYWVKKMDKYGCFDEQKVTIEDGGTFDVNITVNNAKCTGTGSLKFYIASGSAPYKVQIYGPTNKVFNTYYSSFNVTKLEPGDYKIYIKDKNGCFLVNGT
ncbi:MAG: Kazal-type serine protease inhibitor domain-containing protein, partial [Bacteroidota bacterium]